MLANGEGKGMFGFLINGDVNDDAARLKTFADMALNKYGTLPEEELRAAIHRDFDEANRHDEGWTINFRFGDFRGFLFSFERPFNADGRCRDLTVIGRGKYLGFMLLTDGADWHCSADNSMGYRPTRGARKLARVMISKFGTRTFDDIIRGMGRYGR